MTTRRRPTRLAVVALAVLGALAGTLTAMVGDVAAPVAAGGRGPADEAPPSPADPDRPITDPALVRSIQDAVGAVAPGSQRVPVVNVEVLTASTTDVEHMVRSLGGAVTGAVDGQLVQASMPARRVAELAVADGVSYVRAPERVSHPPAPVRTRAERAGGPAERENVGPGTGAVIGQNVALTNAVAWQAAGIGGAVKVGIIDYFDLGLWSPSEEGPLPDPAHRFCQDTSIAAASQDNLCNPAFNNGVNDGDGFEHGVAVAQVVKDMAPAAELYLATVGTAADLQAAIDFFANNGVRILTRSLGAAYDGPGDGTGPLASIVDDAVSRGLTWFNSAGNDATDGYARIVVPDSLGATGNYVDFDNGPGVDTLLRISGSCVLFDGVRWSDWNRAPRDRSDYAIEYWEPTSDPGTDESVNPAGLVSLGAEDASQVNGAPPLEAADTSVCPHNGYGFAKGIMYLRIRRNTFSSTTGDPDVLEVAIGDGYMEFGRSQAPFSAAKPVVDSRNPGLVAVGAVDPANGSGTPDALAFYSSQGPTNDLRIKPDVSAPSCVSSSIYAPSCFNGTSAASPTVAGMAALLLDAGIALPGVPLAAAVKHFVVDRPFAAGGPPDGADNKYGTGQVRLPSAPVAAPAVTAAAYHPVTPTRIIDTRTVAPGPQPVQGIVDLRVLGGQAGVPDTATAVAVNVTVTNTLGDGFVQAVPFLRSTYGTSSTLNVPAAHSTKANFAIVPVGVDGKISVYLQTGGSLIVDVLGYFAPVAGAVGGGRFVAIDPVRALDTRGGPRPNSQSIVVPSSSSAVPAGVAALVLNVTSTQAQVPGYLRAQPSGTEPGSSTVNFVPGVDASNTVIVPVGADGTVSVWANSPSHIVVDITGYITADSAAPVTAGLFVPLATARAYDSRLPAPGSPVPTAFVRTVQFAGASPPQPQVPAGATGISINLTAVDEIGPGYLTAFAPGGAFPATSSLNYLANQAVANAALVKLSSGGSLSIYANVQSHVVIDVNGYFTG